ncbi:tyrosine-type recombinase/integrase [Kineosporia rhizophila]|uniref:tyrosine-type recombinase/integrase n=1 Tax=Kineosporia rhizophila TaxID=84633 RepID=UPI001E528923|nr:tyrosine-type recombinase/integrase [Kineosporia rhizophila]
MNTTYDVRVHSILTNTGQRGKTYTVRWKVENRPFRDTFATKALAESYRSKLLIAQREGTAFDVASGLPEPIARKLQSRSFLTHAQEFVDAKWPHSSPKHRISIAEALATITPALLTSDRGAPAPKELRAALYGWAFNKTRRESGEMPDDIARILAWVERNVLSINDCGDAAVIRKALDLLALRLDGKAAAPNTIARRRGIVYGMLKYAVELQRLDTHPFTYVSWTSPKADDQVDRRTVPGPALARKLIDTAGEIRPDLRAFFGCLYYSALRPEEALHLSRSNYERPGREGDWGWFTLTGATIALGKEWTGADAFHEDRGLKHRSQRSTRRVPVPPQLVQLLDRHIVDHQVPPTGRLFVTRRGSNPGLPLSAETYTRIWRQTRIKALTAEQQAAGLARVPYQLRHAGVSLWLNAGVPGTQVAEWAGHSLHVLLKVYAKCIDGEEDAARQRISAALNA